MPNPVHTYTTPPPTHTELAGLFWQGVPKGGFTVGSAFAFRALIFGDFHVREKTWPPTQ